VAGEWAEYSFTELIETKALEIGDGYRAKNSELGGDGPIFLRAGHVRDTHIDLQGVDRFHSRLANIVGSKMCQSKDVIVTTKGNSTGRTSYVSEDLPPFVYSPHLSYWRCLDTEIIDSGFLRYWSQSEDFRNQLAGLSASTDMAPYLSLIDQKRLKIALPSIHEQRAIGRFLGALDDKIELNRRMNETLETMARALFKSWFVDFDPIRAKAEGRDPALPKSIANLFPARLIGSELGEIPEGWEVGSLERVAELVRIQTNPFETPEHVFSHCSIPAFDNGQLPLEEAGIAIKSMKFCVVTGTVLFSKLNPTIERVWLVDPQPNESAICSMEFLVLRPKTPFGRCILYCLLRSPNFRESVNFLVTGTSNSHQRARADGILEIPIALPPAGIAARFEELATPLLDRTLTNRRQSQTLAKIRDALLPKLISGEMPAKEVGRVVAEAAA
jgi:type I restriction enzyme, S subunit